MAAGFPLIPLTLFGRILWTRRDPRRFHGTTRRGCVVSRLLVRTVRSLRVKLEVLGAANSQKAEVLAHTVSQHLNRKSESGAK